MILNDLLHPDQKCQQKLFKNIRKANCTSKLFFLFWRVAGLRLEHDFACANMRVSLSVPFVLVCSYRDLKPENVLLDEHGHVSCHGIGAGHALCNDTNPALFARKIPNPKEASRLTCH